MTFIYSFIIVVYISILELIILSSINRYNIIEINEIDLKLTKPNPGSIKKYHIFISLNELSLIGINKNNYILFKYI